MTQQITWRHLSTSTARWLSKSMWKTLSMERVVTRCHYIMMSDFYSPLGTVSFYVNIAFLEVVESTVRTVWCDWHKLDNYHSKHLNYITWKSGNSQSEGFVWVGSIEENQKGEGVYVQFSASFFTDWDHFCMFTSKAWWQCASYKSGHGLYSEEQSVNTHPVYHREAHYKMHNWELIFLGRLFSCCLRYTHSLMVKTHRWSSGVNLWQIREEGWEGERYLSGEEGDVG